MSLMGHRTEEYIRHEPLVIEPQLMSSSSPALIAVPRFTSRGITPSSGLLSGDGVTVCIGFVTAPGHVYATI